MWQFFQRSPCPPHSGAPSGRSRTPPALRTGLPGASSREAASSQVDGAATSHRPRCAPRAGLRPGRRAMIPAAGPCRENPVRTKAQLASRPAISALPCYAASLFVTTRRSGLIGGTATDGEHGRGPATVHRHVELPNDRRRTRRSRSNRPTARGRTVSAGHAQRRRTAAAGRLARHRQGQTTWAIPVTIPAGTPGFAVFVPLVPGAAAKPVEGMTAAPVEPEPVTPVAAVPVTPVVATAAAPVEELPDDELEEDKEKTRNKTRRRRRTRRGGCRTAAGAAPVGNTALRAAVWRALPAASCGAPVRRLSDCSAGHGAAATAAARVPGSTLARAGARERLARTGRRAGRRTRRRDRPARHAGRHRLVPRRVRARPGVIAGVWPAAAASCRSRTAMRAGLGGRGVGPAVGAGVPQRLVAGHVLRAGRAGLRRPGHRRRPARSARYCSASWRRRSPRCAGLPWVGRHLRAAGTARPSIGNNRRVPGRSSSRSLVLLVFGALLSSADAAFSQVLAISFPTINAARSSRGFPVRPVALVAVAAVYTGRRAAGPVHMDKPGAARLRRIEWALPIGALVVLFGGFVAVQVTVLFGGQRHVLRDRRAQLRRVRPQRVLAAGRSSPY